MRDRMLAEVGGDVTQDHPVSQSLATPPFKGGETANSILRKYLLPTLERRGLVSLRFEGRGGLMLYFFHVRNLFRT